MDEQRDNMGLRLLKNSKRGLLRTVFSRVGLMSIMIITQFFVLFSVFYWFEDVLPHYMLLVSVFTLGMLLYLINSGMDATSKITWLVLISVVPVFGSFLLWYTRRDVGHQALRRRVDSVIAETRELIPQQPEVFTALEKHSPGAASLARYLQRSGCHRVYGGTKVSYFPDGESKFRQLLAELEKAEKFIFVEYFIIEEGVMWGQMLEILARKAKQGVEVRVMYDGTCEYSHLPRSYPKQLSELGIKCRAFAPIMPFVSTHYNNRDHRKILVIDGRVAFNGGINLSDEYINIGSRFGHWKDTAVMLEGEAVRGFTLMFLQLWHLGEKNPAYDAYLLPPPAAPDGDGFVIPYGDSPLDREKAAERVYMDILNRSRRYVHIMTPYLILDGEMETALKFAAERGVDVSIILPGIPDKTVPYALAKTHYKSLLASGVKIYEYTPGFVHAKSFVCDDAEAVVGTINLDYRSLYHHFECATYMNGCACIKDIEADFAATREKCRAVTEETRRHDKLKWKILGPIMKITAPLL